MAMTNADIARVFNHIGIALELDGANPFRVRAYYEAARVIESNPEPMASLAAQEGRLLQIRGIGKDMAQKIGDLVRTGSTALYDEIKQKYPAELLALTSLPGLGPKRVKVLFDPSAANTFLASDFYWLQMMGRLAPGATRVARACEMSSAPS